ncbi:hypothetical protein EYC80_009534 [Monilinia laxa]|uniref:Uncharacterized protein n=1 Tax=Monilinia laxa TaxID=61186 RepID=A0A5N6JYJ1_MONLA|nr:hypothetical protein EYC80_009534 [Monilinia laxa]
MLEINLADIYLPTQNAVLLNFLSAYYLFPPLASNSYVRIYTQIQLSPSITLKLYHQSNSYILSFFLYASIIHIIVILFIRSFR